MNKNAVARWRTLLEQRKGRALAEYLTRLTGPAPASPAMYTKISPIELRDVPALKRLVGQQIRGETPQHLVEDVARKIKRAPKPNVEHARHIEDLVHNPPIKPEDFVTLRHGTTQGIAEQIATHGPNASLLELRQAAIGRFGRPDFSGMFVHRPGEFPRAEESIRDRLKYYGMSRAETLGGGTPAVLEFEFPRAALGEANLGYENVVPRSLWPLAKNVRIKAAAVGGALAALADLGLYQVKSAAEFAPGIPSGKPISRLPSIKPTTLNRWTLAVQDHEAARAGRHYDLRLVDPDAGKAHSWAIPKARLPEPGEKLLAVQTFTHTPEYALHFGDKKPEVIPEGYGKGRVRMAVKAPVDIIEANNDRVRFNLYEGKNNQEFVLRRTRENKWLLQNVTITKATTNVPQSKPTYKETEPDKVDVTNDDQLMMAKVDGAHNTFRLNAGDPVRVFSYRPSERDTGLIEHTHRFLPGLTSRVPDHLDGLVLRGELFAADPHTGRAREAVETGAVLNSGVWKSRDTQTHSPLRAVVFDVARRNGKDVESVPYQEKLDILKRVNEALPFLELPPMAGTAKEKIQLLERIRSGREPITSEGVVMWPLGGGAPIKAKFRPDHDVYVREVFPEAGTRDRFAGGFAYSWTPRGKIVGRVGTGITHDLKQDMLAHPEKYIGRVARVRALGLYTDKDNPKKPGALRAPSFQDWHLDKGMQPLDDTKKVE